MPWLFCFTKIILCVCVFSIADYLAKSEEHMSRLADNVLDALTSGEHSKQLKETETVRKTFFHVITAFLAPDSNVLVYFKHLKWYTLVFVFSQLGSLLKSAVDWMLLFCLG